MFFTSNFTPQIHKKKSKNKKKILLKSLFIFMLLLKNSNNIYNVSIFVKPLSIRKLVMLRAPYRYKLARLHLTVNRYTTVVILSVRIPNPLLFNDIFLKKNFLNTLGSSFESIFLHQKKFTFSFKIIDEKNFQIKNFNVIFAKYRFIQIFAKN